MVRGSQEIPKLAQSDKPSRFVLKAAAVVTSTAVLLTLAVFAVVVMHRSSTYPVDIGLPTRLLPGKPLPPDAHCEWYMASENNLYCVVTEEGLSAYISYDIRQQVIRTASLPIRDKVVGELILAWGEPSGFSGSGLSNQVNWGNRSVYVISTPFSPNTRAGYIFYSITPYTAEPWRGFINHIR